MFCGLGDEGRSLFTIFLVLIPAALYIMGLMGGKKGRYFFLSGIFFHAISIFLRGIETGGMPLAEKHDNISFLVFSTALVYWYFSRGARFKSLGMIALPMVSVMMMASASYIPINTISPFLKTPWFYLHIFFYFAGYGFFGISACLGINYLFGGSNDCESSQYNAAVIGWVIFSVSLVIGSIWFYVAYGTYWLWTSKELWTGLTWFFYGIYLHARMIKVLKGRPAALIGCLGFIAALFTYFGVGTIIPSPPTQF